MEASDPEYPQQITGAAQQTDRRDEDSACQTQPSSTTPDHRPATERRRDPRHNITDALSVALIENGEQLGTGWLRNVTSNGLFIETPAGSFENTHVRLLFSLPGDHEEYRSWGKVSHRANGGLGLNMDVLEPATRDAIEAVQHFVGG